MESLHRAYPLRSKRYKIHLNCQESIALWTLAGPVRAGGPSWHTIIYMSINGRWDIHRPLRLSSSFFIPIHQSPSYQIPLCSVVAPARALLVIPSRLQSMNIPHIPSSWIRPHAQRLSNSALHIRLRALHRIRTLHSSGRGCTLHGEHHQRVLRGMFHP